METIDIVVRGERRAVPAGRPVDVMVPDYNILIRNTVFGAGVIIWSNVNIYGASIGAETRIGAFVEIRTGVAIGSRVKIEPFVFIPEGVVIEDAVFIGPNVTFTNDLFPRATTPDGAVAAEYSPAKTFVRRGASLGAGSCILCGTTIGEDALIGMGSIVTSNVPPRTVVYGDHARIRRTLD